MDYLHILALKEFGIGLILSLEFKVLSRAEQDCSGVFTSVSIFGCSTGIYRRAFVEGEKARLDQPTQPQL